MLGKVPQHHIAVKLTPLNGSCAVHSGLGLEKASRHRILVLGLMSPDVMEAIELAGFQKESGN